MIWYNFTLPFPANITKDFLGNNFFQIQIQMNPFNNVMLAHCFSPGFGLKTA